MEGKKGVDRMAYGWGYGNPAAMSTGGYFNANYTPQELPWKMPGPNGGAVSVRSEQEARQMQIPLDGSRTVFVNEANGEIYTKMLSMEDGSIRFEAYVRRAEPEDAGAKGESEQMRALCERVEALERAMAQGAGREMREGEKT